MKKKSKSYELSPELWEIVMTYFHSAYKKPSHYEAIMNCKYFVRRRGINIDWGMSPIRNMSKYGVFDSFYISIILNNWNYWEHDDLAIRRPSVTMVRKVAKGQVKKDFEKIWEMYAVNTNENNLLSKIHY
jgi:hypothetical protein